ncbi:MAG TPA: phosphatidate cytidylyltransferase [Gemmatimonadaceae bacterium]|nr:phosphatidate cytidylyltransferase [Gemmatimonadaceae bacterium]
MSELTRRILFALVGAPLTVALIYVGGWVFAAALGAVSAIGAWELFRMAREGGSRPLEIAGIILAASIPLFVHAAYLGVFRMTLTGAVLIFLALFASVIWVRGVAGRPLVAVSVTVVGIIYPALVSYMYPLRYHDYAVGALAGTVLVMFPVTVTWATDIGAYVFGRLLGRRKLIPSVSPSKTVAGAIGGLVVAVAGCWAYASLLLCPYAKLALAPAGMMLFAIVVGIAAQIGDLAESLLKRDAGVKDSSRLLPGHGGILDRFDSLLFVLPAAYVILGYLLMPARG